MPTIAHWCGCCALPIRGNPPDDECPRCHYPVEIQKEERFLVRSLQDLHRVAVYQRSNLTVGELIATYQARMRLLQREQQAGMIAHALATMPPAFVQEPPTVSPAIQAQQSTQPTAPTLPEPVISTANQGLARITQPVQESSAEETLVAPSSTRSPRQVFSLRSFFEDQTINIVASLGAFMILAGSLGFVATTDRPLLSFLVMLLVHAVFGVVGLVAQRFASFRVVSLIYTAIFALLIPLVGFSAYQLTAGSLVTISPPALIAIASAYAAIAYGSLAVYQRFSVFGYLALAALTIADLAATYALHLSPPWICCALMPLALIAMLYLPKDKLGSSVFDGRLAILREPLTIAMYAWVVICVLGIPYALVQATFLQPDMLEPRLALTGQIVLLLLWDSGMAWRTRKERWVMGACHLFVALALALCFTFSLHIAEYGLVLICVALLYHLLARFATPLMGAFQSQRLAIHLEEIALFLTVVAPLIGMLDMPRLLIQRSFAAGSLFTLPLGDALTTLCICGLGLGITLSALAHHLSESPRIVGNENRITLHLLLGSFLLYWGCGVLLLLLPIHPTWLFLGVTLLLLALAFQMRSKIGASLSLPLEIMALVGIGLALIFAITLPDTVLLALLFGFEGLCYVLALSQRRPRWLWLAALFPLLTLGPLFHHQALLFGLSLVLPIGAAFLSRRTQHVILKEGMKRPFAWEWVFFQQALLYGLYNLFLIGLGILFPGAFQTLAQELHITLPATLELALLAGAWYLVAVITRRAFWLGITTFFAVIVICLPGNSFQFQSWLAPLSILVALGIRMRFGRVWSLPFAITAVLATLMVSVSGQAEHTQTAMTWVLLSCAALYYLAGTISREQLVSWLAPATFLLIMISTHTITLVAWIAPISILLVLGVRLVTGRNAALPLALCALIATLNVGFVGATWSEMGIAAWVLLLCAQLISIGGLVTREPAITWIAPLFTTWSVYYAGLQGDLYRPAVIALTFALLGIVSKYISVFRTDERQWWHSYRLPLYATALASALLTGIYGSLSNVNIPFYTAVPDILILYALIAYLVLLNERRVATLWQGLVLGFAVWGLVLGTRIAACSTALHMCAPLQIQQEGWYLLGLTVAMGTVGLLIGHLARIAIDSVESNEQRSAAHSLRWNACWYLASMIGIIILAIWQRNVSSYQYNGLTPLWLTTLLILSLGVMLIESIPEVLVLSSGLAYWIIRDLPWTHEQQALTYSGLMLLIFAAPLLWRKRAPATRLFSPHSIAQALSIGGQYMVVVWIAWQGGLHSQPSSLAHTGALSLLILAGLVGLTGYSRRALNWHRWFYYGALLLASGAISWELLALQQTGLDVLTLPPATCLILIAAFLQRDEGLPAQRLGTRLCATLGATLLLLPTLWLSFRGETLSPTLLLGGEALILLLIGVGTRIRVFVLSGAALVIVAAMHALFLPTLGLPPSLALAIMGFTLLILATALSLTRHRLRDAWVQWQ